MVECHVLFQFIKLWCDIASYSNSENKLCVSDSHWVDKANVVAINYIKLIMHS